MKKKIPLLIISFFISTNVFSQAPAIQWQKSFGGTGWDTAYPIQQTSDGGYIAGGWTASNNGDVTGSHGGWDCWFVKLDGSGIIQWQKSFGGTLYDVAYSIRQTSDGGYIAAGDSHSNDGDVTGHHGLTSYWDYWVVKMDGSGSIQWQKSLGGTGQDYATSIQQTADGGYIVAGESFSNDGDVTGNHGSSDYWIVKLDGNDSIQWQKSLGGTNDDGANFIQQTSDGGYIVAGYSFSNDGDVTGHYVNTDYWVVKLDGGGTIQWQKSLGGTGEDRANFVQQTSDGGYVIAGTSQSSDMDVTGNHGSFDYWIVKLDGSGTIQWQKSLGGTGEDRAYSIQQTADGSYIAAGYSMSNDGDVIGNHGNYDYWLVKLDGSGNIQWQKSLGGTGDDEAYSFQQTSDGGYIVVGESKSNDGDVTGNHGNYDYWVIKLSPEVGIEELNPFSSLNLSPNPATNELALISSESGDKTEIEIYNVLGEKIYSRQPKTSNHQPITVNVSALAPGIYFLKVRGEKDERVAKFVKQ